MIVVLVPMAPPGLALTVVAAFAVVSVVVPVIALGGRRRLSGRLRDDRRWRRGCNGALRR
jgi:hypothetical protein